MTPERTVNKNLALVLLAAAQFVVVLDASIVNVALPSIGRDLQFSQENLSWVVNAYTLTFGGFLLLGGRMADLLGRRRLFMAGIVLFGVASLLGGLAETEGQLIAARALALIAGFVAIERSSRAPLVPFPGIFRIRTISGINLTALFIAMALFSMFFFISLYMQQVLGYDALKAGLSYLPLAGGIIVSAGLASALTTRFGFKPVLIAGLLLTASGLIWFSQVSADGGYVSDILFPSLLAAGGLRLPLLPIN